MRYQETVTLYSTVVVEAEDEVKAAEKIHRLLDAVAFLDNDGFAITDKDFIVRDKGKIIVGEYDREDEPKPVEES